MSSIGKLVRKSQATLFWGVQGLPKAQREAIYTLYAFCTHIDNVVDGKLPDKQKKELLTAWQQELENIYEKKVPVTDIGRKIYKNCMRFKIKKEDFSEILKCSIMEFPNPLQSPDWETLYKYCYGTAEIPTYIMLSIIGGMDEQSMRSLAQNFGRAMLFTNILKDIKDDAQSGHMYIPAELLEQANIKSTNPKAVITDKNLISVREKLAKITGEYFENSFDLIAKEDKNKMRPLKIILYIYKRYFDIMQNRGWEIISPKPHIRGIDKLAIAYNVIFNK